MRSLGGTSGPSSERSCRPRNASPGGNRSRRPSGAPRKRRVSQRSMASSQAAPVPSGGGRGGPWSATCPGVHSGRSAGIGTTGAGSYPRGRTRRLDLRHEDVAHVVPGRHELERSSTVDLGLGHVRDPAMEVRPGEAHVQLGLAPGGPQWLRTGPGRARKSLESAEVGGDGLGLPGIEHLRGAPLGCCLLYTSDAADERSSVDLGGRRIIKKKKKNKRAG